MPVVTHGSLLQCTKPTIPNYCHISPNWHDPTCSLELRVFNTQTSSSSVMLPSPSGSKMSNISRSRAMQSCIAFCAFLRRTVALLLPVNFASHTSTNCEKTICPSTSVANSWSRAENKEDHRMSCLPVARSVRSQ